MQYTKEEYLETYRVIYFARRYEEINYEYTMTGKLAGFLHLSCGEEAVIGGIYCELGPNDWLQPHFRCRPIDALKLGVREFTAEVQGKKTGLQGGMGGGTHFFSAKHKMGPFHGLLGQAQAIGAGIAHYYKMNKLDGCVVIGAGDGTMNEGVLMEAMNMIAAWKLPVAWYIQTNGIALSTDTKKSSGLPNMAERASGFGFPHGSYDGNDVFLVREVMREAIAKARRGEPTVSEFRVTRWYGHFTGDPEVYRDPAVVEFAKKHHDPVANNRKYLLDHNIANEEEIKSIEAEQDALIRDAFDFAIASESKTREECWDPRLVYA